MNFEERTISEELIMHLNTLERSLMISRDFLNDLFADSYNAAIRNDYDGHMLCVEYAETMDDLIHLLFDARISPICKQLAAFVDESAHAEMKARG